MDIRLFPPYDHYEQLGVFVAGKLRGQKAEFENQNWVAAITDPVDFTSKPCLNPLLPISATTSPSQATIISHQDSCSRLYAGHPSATLTPVPPESMFCGGILVN